MKIIVVGQGAMGLLWYHHLATSNVTTSLSMLASTQNGLFNADYDFVDNQGVSFQGNVNYANNEHIRVADVILLCVKSFQIKSVLQEISKYLQNNTNIILGHNGMGTLAELPKEFISKHNIYALLTTHGSLRNAPLSITHTGIGVTDIGLVSGDVEIAEQKTLVNVLNTAFPKVTLHKSIIIKQWLKLAVNCVINPLTALHNIDNGQINNDIFTTKIEEILTEFVAVAKCEGVLLNAAELTKTVHEVAKATAKNCSSMRCDILANRKTEINYINGYIHKLGLKHSIATPENTKLLQAIFKREKDHSAGSNNK